MQKDDTIFPLKYAYQTIENLTEYKKVARKNNKKSYYFKQNVFVKLRKFNK